MSWELGGQLLVRTEKGQYLKPCPYPLLGYCPYPGRPQLSSLDQQLGGNLLGLPQEQEELDLLQGLQILGLVALGWRVRTWERLDIGIIIYALRPSEARISRDPSSIKGFTPSDVEIVPGNSKKFLSKPTLSLLHPQGIQSLIFGLSYLL